MLPWSGDGENPLSIRPRPLANCRTADRSPPLLPPDALRAWDLRSPWNRTQIRGNSICALLFQGRHRLSKCLRSHRATHSPSGRRYSRKSRHGRWEEHTSELQSLMRISYSVFCLKKKTTHTFTRLYNHTHAHYAPSTSTPTHSRSACVHQLLHITFKS